MNGRATLIVGSTLSVFALLALLAFVWSSFSGAPPRPPNRSRTLEGLATEGSATETTTPVSPRTEIPPTTSNPPRRNSSKRSAAGRDSILATGTVQFDHSGEAVPGGKVTISGTTSPHKPNGDYDAQVDIGPDGRFEIDIPRRFRLDWVAISPEIDLDRRDQRQRKEKGHAGFLALHREFEHSPWPSSGLVLRVSKGQSIEGVVLDDESGVEIAGAEILLDRSLNRESTQTDEFGKFSYFGLNEGFNRPLTSLRVRVSKPGYSTLATEILFGPNEDAKEDLEFRLTRGVVVSGRVITRNGDPVSSARLVLSGHNQSNEGGGFSKVHVSSSTESSPDGTFRFPAIRSWNHVVVDCKHHETTHVRTKAFDASRDVEDLEIVVTKGVLLEVVAKNESLGTISPEKWVLVVEDLDSQRISIPNRRSKQGWHFYAPEGHLLNLRGYTQPPVHRIKPTPSPSGENWQGETQLRANSSTHQVSLRLDERRVVGGPERPEGRRINSLGMAAAICGPTFELRCVDKNGEALAGLPIQINHGVSLQGRAGTITDRKGVTLVRLDPGSTVIRLAIEGYLEQTFEVFGLPDKAYEKTLTFTAKHKD